MKRILSIQSHVVSGFAGNKSASFPLQLLGFDVDQINTVQFSNHSKYKTFPGERLSSETLSMLIDGLSQNQLLDYSHILCGYMGRSSQLQVIQQFIIDMKTTHPEFIFVLDPVMGDNGKMYVPQDLLPIYQELCAFADIATPNAYEVELLTGIKVTDSDSALLGISNIHKLGVKTVIITSAELSDKDPLKLYLIGSRKDKTTNECNQFMIEFPKKNLTFTGTGDLFAALLIGYLENDEIENAAEKAISAVQSIIHDTFEFSMKSGVNDCKSLELRIVHGKKAIENPIVCFKSVNLNYKKA